MRGSGRIQGPLNVKVALERRFGELLDAKMALERRFRVPLDAKLALERRFRVPLDAKLALERRLGATWRFRTLAGRPKP